METKRCNQCKHFFITWNQTTPYGCRLYGIMSKQQPSVIVKNAGSGECQGFSAKSTKEAPKERWKEDLS